MLPNIYAEAQSGIPSLGIIRSEIVAGDLGVVRCGIDSPEHHRRRQKTQKGGIGGHRAHGGVAAGRFALAEFGKDRRRDAVARVEHQLATHPPGLAAVHFLAGCDVVNVPVLPLLKEGAQPEADGFAQRAACGQPEVQLVVGGVAPPESEVEILARRLGDHIHHAGRSVLAEQRALRPAQHFDALDVQQVAEGLGRSDQGHVVHDDGNAGFNIDAEDVGANAPQTEAAVGGPVPPIDRQRRRDAGDVGELIDAHGFKGRLVHRANRNRHILHALRAFRGCHHDFLNEGLSGQNGRGQHHRNKRETRALHSLAHK